MLTINKNVIDELRELMEEDFEDLIESFIEDIQIKVSQIKEFVKNKDGVNLHQKSHSLKGASKNIGAEKMATLCSILEQAGKKNTHSNTVQISNELDEEAKKVITILKNIN